MSTPLVNVKIPRFKAGRKNLIESGYLTLEDMAAVENPHQLLKYRGVGQVTLRRLQSEAERLGLEWKSKPKPKAPLPLIKNRYAMKDKLADALAEVRVLKNEIARLNGQTNWVCKCGGTDCEGQKENAALRADKERLDWLTDSLGWIVVGYPEADPSQHATEDNTIADAWRAAIDAALKEAQP